MDTLLDDRVRQAFKEHRCGGRLKPLCNRRIDGYRCRCWVRYVVVDDVQYWKIFYLINYHEPYDESYRPLVRRMYRLAATVKSLVESQGARVVIYRNNGYTQL